MPAAWLKLDTAIAPDWNHVEPIRASLNQYLSTVFLDGAYCYALTLVVSELLENAIKFGEWARSPSAQIKLRVHSDSKAGAMVEVSAPCTPTSDEAKDILHCISELSPTNAEALYKRRLLVVAQKPDGAEADCALALLRVAYEAGCTLSAAMEVDDSLRITAMVMPPPVSSRELSPAAR